MKVIIDITKEGLMYAKMLSMCGMADGFHEAIAEGIPVIDGSELASLLIDMRINGDIHDTTFIIPRSGDTYNNEVIVKRYKTDEVSRCPEIEKSEIDNVISKLDRCMECMLESDHRSFTNRETENGWIFDHIIEWRKMIQPYIKEE